MAGGHCCDQRVGDGQRSALASEDVAIAAGGDSCGKQLLATEWTEIARPSDETVVGEPGSNLRRDRQTRVLGVERSI